MKTNIELPSPPRRSWRREARSAGAGQGREILPWGITALTEYANYTIFFSQIRHACFAVALTTKDLTAGERKCVTDVV
jgi:hypothetical protein